MNPEYIRLSNKHYLLSESYIPDLEKVPTLAKGGIKWRGKDTPKEGHRLQPAAVQALCDMNAEIRALAEESLPAAALYSMRTTQEFLRRTNRPFFPVAQETMKYLEGTLSPRETQLLAAMKR